jgi:mono/diheme cytochrome c family protein
VPIRRPHFVLPLLTAGGLLLLGAAAGAALLLSGAVTTAATAQHFRITHRILEVGLHSSIYAHTRNIAAPPLDDPQMVEVGLACYRDHCAQCHGAPGIAPQPAALGMLPIPASLAQTARDWPAESLYYVTSKGVRMTGMPAWEYRLSDHSLWSTVAFVRTLPQLDAAQYRERTGALTAQCEARSDLPDLPLDELGDILLRQYGCHACHVIEGVVGPPTFTGPALRDWPRRGYIAGVLPNTRANLALWIRDPRATSPQTLMPDLGVPPRHAEAMAAFLFSQ